MPYKERKIQVEKVDRFTPNKRHMMIYAVQTLQSKRRDLLTTYDHVKTMNEGGYTYEVIDMLNEMEDHISSVEEAIIILKNL